LVIQDGLTHGEPSDINSHPHGNKRVTIVHNGIIENYKKLKDFLVGEGYSFAMMKQILRLHAKLH